MPRRRKPDGQFVPDYTQAEREAAFLVWSTTAGRNSAEASRVLGIPYQTITQWKKDDRWEERRALDDLESVRYSAPAIKMALEKEVLPNIITLINIRNDPESSRRDKMEAVKMLMSYSGWYMAPINEGNRAKLTDQAVNAIEVDWRNISDDAFEGAMRMLRGGSDGTGVDSDHGDGAGR